MFKIRSYGRTELAQLYNPELTPPAAWRTLQRWISFNKPLQERLLAIGMQKNQRRYTPAMVAAIVEHLGDP